MKAKKKNRAGMISFMIHLMLLVLALYPFTRMAEVDHTETAYIPMIEIAFENGDMSPGKASTKPELKAKTEITTEQAEKSPVNEEVVVLDKKVKEQNEWVEEEPSDFLNSEKGVEDDFNQEEEKESQKEEDVFSEMDMEGNSESDVGEGEVGEEITGVALANMDFEGEGVFGRKIIYHAEIAKLAEKEGRVVVNLCINKAGRVTHVAFNRDESTISASDYVRDVMLVAGKYRFEEDYDAPSTQCGRLTFIFRFD